MRENRTKRKSRKKSRNAPPRARARKRTRRHTSVAHTRHGTWRTRNERAYRLTRTRRPAGLGHASDGHSSRRRIELGEHVSAACGTCSVAPSPRRQQHEQAFRAAHAHFMSGQRSHTHAEHTQIGRRGEPGHAGRDVRERGPGGGQRPRKGGRGGRGSPTSRWSSPTRPAGLAD